MSSFEASDYIKSLSPGVRAFLEDTVANPSKRHDVAQSVALLEYLRDQRASAGDPRVPLLPKLSAAAWSRLTTAQLVVTAVRVKKASAAASVQGAVAAWKTRLADEEQERALKEAARRQAALVEQQKADAKRQAERERRKRARTSPSNLDGCASGYGKLHFSRTATNSLGVEETWDTA